MADTLPLTFPIPSGGSIASYNYVDIAEGTGISIFYAAGAQDSTGVKYILTRENLNSEISEVYASIPASDPVKINDLDFDLSYFNTPKIIKGKGYISIPTLCVNSSGSTVDYYFIVTIRKVISGVESDIVAVTSATITTPVSGSDRMMLIPFTVPKTYYKRGEVLRVTIEYWAGGNGGTTAGGFAFDPAGNYTASVYTAGSINVKTSRTSIYIPFELDL